MTERHARSHIVGARLEQRVLHAGYLLLHGLERLADDSRTHALGAQVANFDELEEIVPGEGIGNGNKSRALPTGQLARGDVQETKNTLSTVSIHVNAKLIELSADIALGASGKPRKTVENRGLGSFTVTSGDSYNLKQADVAQLVEQSIRNRQVIGSSPIVGSTKFLRFRYMPTLPAGIVFECGGFCGDSHITLRLLRRSIASRIAPNSGCW